MAETGSPSAGTPILGLTWQDNKKDRLRVSAGTVILVATTRLYFAQPGPGICARVPDQQARSGSRRGDPGAVLVDLR